MRISLCFSRSSHISDLKPGTAVAILQGTWGYRVSNRTGWPGVGILSQDKRASLIHSFYLIASARQAVRPPVGETLLYLHRSDAAEVLPPLDRPCDQDGGSTHFKATTVWRARAGSQETVPSLKTFQGHSESRLEME